MASQLIAPEIIDASRFERIDGQLVERPVPDTPHSCIQMQFVLLLTQALQGSKGKTFPELSITRPGHAEKDDPDFLTPDVLVAYPPFRKAKNLHLAWPGRDFWQSRFFLRGRNYLIKHCCLLPGVRRMFES